MLSVAAFGLGITTSPARIHDGIRRVNAGYDALDNDIQKAGVPQLFWQRWDDDYQRWRSFYNEHNDDSDAYLFVNGDSVANELEGLRVKLLEWRNEFESTTHRPASAAVHVDEPLFPAGQPTVTVGLDPKTQEQIDQTEKKMDTTAAAFRFLGWSVLGAAAVGVIWLFRRK